MLDEIKTLEEHLSGLPLTDSEKQELRTDIEQMITRQPQAKGIHHPAVHVTFTILLTFISLTADLSTLRDILL